MKSIHFIIHGKLKDNRLYHQCKSALEALNEFALVYKYTEGQNHATELAAESVEQNANVIVAVGGDGTAHEVLNGMINSEVILGIIPCGTGNDFMRSVAPFSVAKFVENVQQLNASKIDIGHIQFDNSETHFLNIADIGFGAEVVMRMDRQRNNGIRGKFSYSLAILRTFFSYHNTSLSLQSKEQSFDGSILMLAFCNGKALGHGLTIHPQADITDGKLGITMFGNVSLFTYVRYLSHLKRGKVIQHKEVKYWTTDKVEITSNASFHIEADGELYMKNVQSVSIITKGIQFLGVTA